MTKAEFPHLLDVRQADGKDEHLVAGEAQRIALAARFDLVRIDRLEAQVLLRREGREVEASGTLEADIIQSCAVSGEDLAVAIREPIAFRFVPAKPAADLPEELDLDAADLDEIEYAGTHFDLGEAVAQSLGLAIDPYLTGPDAEETRRKSGIATPEASGPFAALRGLGSNDG